MPHHYAGDNPHSNTSARSSCQSDTTLLPQIKPHLLLFCKLLVAVKNFVERFESCRPDSTSLTESMTCLKSHQ